MSLLKTLTGKDFNISFPHTLLGQDGHTKEHNLEYYKQLTKYQVKKFLLHSPSSNIIVMIRFGNFTTSTEWTMNCLDILQQAS